LIHYAERNKNRVSEPDAVIKALKELHDDHFENVADVVKALGNIR